MTELKNPSLTDVARKDDPKYARPTVLFPVSEYGEFFTMVDLGRILDAELGLHPVFLFKHDYGAITPHSHFLERLNFSWTSAASPNQFFDARANTPGVSDYIPLDVLVQRGEVPPAELGKPPRFAALAFGLLALWGYVRVRASGVTGPRAPRARRGSLLMKRYYRAQIKTVEHIIKEFAPQIIISGQDYPLSVTSLAAQAGVRFGVRTLILPFSMTPTTKEIAESFFGTRTNILRWRPMIRLVARVMPKWLHKYRGRFYTRLSLLEARTSDTLGLTPEQPWTPNAGKGVILAPSAQGRDYCLDAGISPQNVVLTGALWNDRLLDLAPTRGKRRDALLRDILVFETYARLRAKSRALPRRPDPVNVEEQDSDRKILIFSWPPNQSPRRPNGLSSFEQLNHALVEMLTSLSLSTKVKLAISLHPTLAETELGAELKAAGLTVLDKPLLEVIDCADIFCATVSSTLIWTLQLGLPSVNFDIYSYGYKEFTDSGMAEAATVAGLRAELMRLIEEPAYLETVRERMLATRDYWTLADGKARTRIVDTVRSMAKPRPAKGSA